MSEIENKALMRRYFEEIDAAAKDKRGASFLDDFVASDFVNHDPSPGFTPDLKGLKQTYNYFLAANPDGYHVVEDMIAEGDKVVTRLSAYGTQTGELFGIPPTNKQISMTAITIHRIANGKIVEHWSELDNLGLMQQLSTSKRYLKNAAPLLRLNSLVELKQGVLSVTRLPGAVVELQC